MTNKSKMQKPSTYEIISKGQLWVNIPVMIIIFGTLYLLSLIVDWGFQACVIIAVATGWIYWEFAVIKWIRWALDNNVEQDRLLRLGKRGFLLWNRGKIDSVVKKIDN